MTERTAVTLELAGRIGIVRFNRPAAMNAVDDAIRQGLMRALSQLDAGAEADAIVLTGTGERAFCAGQDLEESAAITPANLAGWLNRQHAMYQAVRDVTKPIVAAVNGTAAGAGFQMALMCDLRVAHPEVRMGQPEVRAGLASIVGSWVLSLQVGHSLNQQLSLTGELVSGERAHALGLVNELVPREQVLERALHLARALAAQPRTAFRLTKQRFRERTQAGFEEACNAGIRYQLECYASGEPARVMEEFLARRQRKDSA